MYIVAFFNCLSLLSCLAQMDYVFGTTYPACNVRHRHENVCVRAALCRQIDTIYERHSLCEAFFELNSDRIRLNWCVCVLFALTNVSDFIYIGIESIFHSRFFSGILLFQKLNQFISNYRIALDLDTHSWRKYFLRHFHLLFDFLSNSQIERKHSQ